MARRQLKPSYFALYHFEEFSHGALENLVDSKGGRTLSGTSSTGSAKSTNAINSLGAQIRYARCCHGTTEMSRAGSASALLVAGGTHTEEYLFRVDQLGARQVIFSYARTAAPSSARNKQFEFAITATGQLAQRWESGAGSTVQDAITTDPNLAVVVGKWYYASMVLVRSVTPGANSVAFALRSADNPTIFTQTVTGLNQPTGGDAAEVSWRYGWNGLTTGGSKEQFLGAVSCISVSNQGVSRSDQATRCLALDGPMKFSDDADTFGLWLCNEQPDAIDEVGGLHLQMSSLTATAIAPRVQNVGGPDVFGKLWTGAVTSLRLQSTAGPDPRALALNALLKTSYTIAMQFREEDTIPGTSGLAAFTIDPTDETQPNNYTLIQLTGTGANLRFTTEHGAGVDAEVAVVPAIGTPALQASVHHIVIAVELLPGGTQQRVTIWLNGAIIGTGDIATYDGGELGRYNIGQGISTTATFRGVIGAGVIDTLTWNQSLVDEDLEQITSGGDLNPPRILNINPPITEKLGRYQPISFDIVDDGLLRRALPMAYYPGTGDVYLIHDGDGFRDAFKLHGFRIPVSLPEGDGWRYTVLPLDGWITSPVFLPFVYDTSGNENE